MRRMSKKTSLSRREMLQAAAVASFGSAILGGTAVSAQAPRVQVGKDPGQHEPIPPFKFNIESSTGSWTGEAGSAREATMTEFAVSEHIAGVSMRLKPGGIRELHWHAIAAEWAYVIEGKVMGTVISPNGEPATDIFMPGDLWYFPRGHGHAVQNVGNTDAHFILGFDDGHFSEYGTFSITDWVARSSPEVVAKNLGLPLSVVRGLPTKEVYIIPGKIPQGIEEYIGEGLQENQNPHKYSLARAPLTTHPGGWIRHATQKEFPINATLTSVLQYLDPGAIRELHWHPNADEWQYILEGQSRVTVFGAHGRTRTEECKAGDVVFIQQGFGHYVENTGRTPLRFFALFNSPGFEEISITSWLAGNPAQLIADNFNIPKSEVAKMPKRALGIIKG